jgi:hypothetical protein
LLPDEAPLIARSSSVLGPKKQRDLLLNLEINLYGCTVVSNKTVKDLGVTLEPDLSMTNISRPFQGQLLSIIYNIIIII